MELSLLEYSCWGPSAADIATALAVIGLAGKYVARWSRWSLLVTVPLALLQLKPIVTGLTLQYWPLHLLWSLSPVMTALCAGRLIVLAIAQPRLDGILARCAGAALTAVLAAWLGLYGWSYLWG